MYGCGIAPQSIASLFRAAQAQPRSKTQAQASRSHGKKERNQCKEIAPQNSVTAF